MVEVPKIDVICEHAIISEAITKDVVGLGVALDAVAVLPVEGLEAEVVVIVGGPPVQGLGDDNTELSHLELDLLADVRHDLANCLRNHLLKDLWLSLGLKLSFPTYLVGVEGRDTPGLRRGLVHRILLVVFHNLRYLDHLLEILGNILLVIDTD